MASNTKHRDAVENGLDEMRARYEAMGPAKTPPEQAERELTLAMTEAAMRCLASHRDSGIPDQAFGGGFTGALGNVIASISETLARGMSPVSLMLVDVFTYGAGEQAVRRVLNQNPADFNQVDVPTPEPHPNRDRDMDWAW